MTRHSTEHRESSLVRVRPAHEAALEDGTTVSQLDYEYSGAMVDHLGEHVRLPATLEKAVLRRQVDFLAGRLCARRALQAAGFKGSAEIARDERGAPIWPAGFLGSITHCDGFAMASVAHAQHIAALGIDVEQRLSAEVASEIQGQLATRQELALDRGRMSPEAWLTMLFSGKESLFKALYPSVGRYFDFLDATAGHLDACAGTFTLALRASLSPEHPQGSTYPIRFHWNGDRVFTRCVLPQPARLDAKHPGLKLAASADGGH